MSYSVQLGQGDQHVAYYTDPTGIVSVFVVEGSEADVKDAIPQLQLMTGHAGEWDSHRIAGYVKRTRGGPRGPRGQSGN